MESTSNRRGEIYVHNEKQLTRQEILRTGNFGDNEVREIEERDEENSVLIVYEAPTEDDPLCGHLSVWVERPSSNQFGKTMTISGDDQELYNKKLPTLERMYS